MRKSEPLREAEMEGYVKEKRDIIFFAKSEGEFSNISFTS